jgi:hypothetical protein
MIERDWDKHPFTMFSMTSVLQAYQQAQITDTDIEKSFLFFNCHPAHVFGDHPHDVWPEMQAVAERLDIGDVYTWSTTKLFQWEDWRIENWKFDGKVPHEATFGNRKPSSEEFKEYWRHRKVDERLRDYDDYWKSLGYNRSADRRKDCDEHVRCSIDLVDEDLRPKTIRLVELLVAAHNEGRINWKSGGSGRIIQSLPTDALYFGQNRWQKKEPKDERTT